MLRWARAARLGMLEGRVALVEVPAGSSRDASGEPAYVLKRVVRDGDRWLLASDNPAGPTIPASANTTAIAIVEQVVRPEDEAPAVGERVADDDLPRAFGLGGSGFAGAVAADHAYARIDGHLFLRIERRGALVEPDRVRAAVADGALDLARDVVRAVLRDPGAGGVLARDGKRLRVVGEAPRGGLRIDGVVDESSRDSGFAERTVSLLDIAWVLVAADNVREHGGVLDEARVNRLRYLEGTPKGSTRWIDTGWALVVVGAAR